MTAPEYLLSMRGLIFHYARRFIRFDRFRYLDAEDIGQTVCMRFLIYAQRIPTEKLADPKFRNGFVRVLVMGTVKRERYLYRRDKEKVDRWWHSFRKHLREWGIEAVEDIATSETVVRDAVKVRAAVADLDERDRRVIVEHYGLSGEQPRTFRELAGGLGITKQRASQLATRALNRLAAKLAGRISPA